MVYQVAVGSEEKPRRRYNCEKIHEQKAERKVEQSQSEDKTKTRTHVHTRIRTSSIQSGKEHDSRTRYTSLSLSLMQLLTHAISLHGRGLIRIPLCGVHANSGFQLHDTVGDRDVC
jgi:hypothetical protein